MKKLPSWLSQPTCRREESLPSRSEKASVERRDAGAICFWSAVNREGENCPRACGRRWWRSPMANYRCLAHRQVASSIAWLSNNTAKQCHRRIFVVDVNGELMAANGDGGKGDWGCELSVDGCLRWRCATARWLLTVICYCGSDRERARRRDDNGDGFRQVMTRCD